MTRKPLVLFGHSLGTLIAYEVARALAATREAPRHLVLSGRRPPYTREGTIPEDGLTDAALIARMRRLGGTPSQVFDVPELLALILPVVRADYRLASGHAPAPKAPPLGIPATILGGSEDADNPPRLFPGWGDWLGGEPEIEVWPGGHFFIRPNADRLVGLLRSVVEAVDRCD